MVTSEHGEPSYDPYDPQLQLDPLVGSERLDFVLDLGARMPMAVIGMLLGIPEQDQEAVRVHQDEKLRREEGRPGEFSEDEFADATFFEEYIDWRANNPSDDLMTQLIQAEFEDETGTERVALGPAASGPTRGSAMPEAFPTFEDFWSRPPRPPRPLPA